MRKSILIAAMVLVSSAAAEAGPSRSLTLASNDPPAAAQPTKAVEPTKAAEPLKTVEPTKAVEAPAAPAAATETPKFVERPAAVEPCPPAGQPAADAKQLDTKPVATQTPKAAKPKHKGWTEARIIGELHRHGIYW
jgi:outer membrane biosynthesis protein TonB